MSQTLGEKLREAREERGISLTEVAEQTRISPHYIESIERDDYKPLPGGIFNKGFIKSFAKYVGVNEQEALLDYAQAISANEGTDEQDLKVYKPEVLTDDYSTRSMIPTVIGAIVILGLMTGGILFGLNYLNSPSEPAKPANINVANTGPNSNGGSQTPPTDPSVPEMATIKVEFKTTTGPVGVRATVDGTKTEDVIGAGASKIYEPKDSITLNYNRWNATKVQLLVNGKSIALPGAPLVPADKDRINFTISKDNLAQIWTNAAISIEVPAATVDGAIVTATPTGAVPGPTVPAVARPTPVQKATTPTTTASPAKTPEAKVTPKPNPTPAKPAANGPN